MGTYPDPAVTSPDPGSASETEILVVGEPAIGEPLVPSGPAATDLPGSGDSEPSTAAKVTGTVKDAASEASQALGESTKRTVSDLRGRVTDNASSTVADQKQRATEGLAGIVDEIQALVARSDDGGTVTQLLDEAEVRLRGVVDWLESRSPEDVLDEVRAFARRRPGTFLAGAALAGVVAGRVTRSTASRVISDATSAAPSEPTALPARSSEPVYLAAGTPGSEVVS
jgi:hypothetical protein